MISWLPPVLHITLFDDMPAAILDELIDGLCEGFAGIQGVALQRRQGRGTQTTVMRGEVAEECKVQEHGLAFWVRPLRNQNVGMFLDMGHVREHLAMRMADANVLNLFAYTCAFSVSAIHHRARQVVNNDMSANALALGRRNHEANGHDLRRVRMLPHDLFRSWQKIAGIQEITTVFYFL